MPTIAENLAEIRQRMRRYEKQYNRAAGSVSLLAATKGQSLAKMQAAVHAGQYAFGENYLQEALPKIMALTDAPIEWHFIGRIQRNKTKGIAQHFSWVHSVSDVLIAERLHAARPENLPPINVCIQIKCPAIADVAAIKKTSQELLTLAKYIQQLPRLTLRGLMTMPEPSCDFSQQRQRLHLLPVFFNELKTAGFKLDTLSMGMSDDFEAAIAEGSTLIRIGSAIFGKREPIIPQN